MIVLFFTFILIGVIILGFIANEYPIWAVVSIFDGELSHICSNIGICGVITEDTKKYPTALDVYRGNTTLKITTINGVPEDTVVIYKNN